MRTGWRWDLLTGLLASGLFFLAVPSLGAGAGLVWAFNIAVLAAMSVVDLEEKVIPRKLWLWCFFLAAGFSWLIPGSVWQDSPEDGLRASLIGSAVGAGIIFFMVELGKVLFGKVRLSWEKAQAYAIRKGQDGWILESDGESIPLDQLFMRKSDKVVIEEEGRRVLLWEHEIDLGDGRKPLFETSGMASGMVIPREAMGFGDVKFMIMAGAMTGWEGAVFAIFAGSVIGTLVGGVIKLLKGHNEIPFIPFLASGVGLFLLFPLEVKGTLSLIFGTNP